MCDSNEFPGIDYDFRPETVWEGPERIFANVKGTYRRRAIHRGASEISTEAIDERIEDSLDEETIRRLPRSHPQLMSGEYLPDYEDDEVEIARVVFQSTILADCAVWRVARIPQHNGTLLYYYRSFDDNGDPLGEWESDHLWSLRELIAAIDGTEYYNDVGGVASQRGFIGMSVHPSVPLSTANWMNTMRL